MANRKFHDKSQNGNNPKCDEPDQQKAATAPYNFVPLNMSVVPADPLPTHDRFYPDRFTGYIDCEITTLTPLYIRDSLTIEEYIHQRKLQEKGKKWDKSDFFSPAGKKRIPGSSIRGMVRNLVEIVSWSKFGFFEDKNLYYRSFADISSLRDEYKKYMNPTDQSGGSTYKMSAGYLVKEGYRYYIYPAEKIQGKQFGKISKEDTQIIVQNMGGQYNNFKFYKTDDGSYLVVSGPMNKKENDWIIFPRDSSKNGLEILEIDIKNYALDENRGNKVPNSIKLYKEYPEIPCFYIEWEDADENQRISFGHTPLFRIAYTKSIKDHLPPVHHSDIIDFAHAIFGYTSEKNEDSFSGRVFFEDAQLSDPDSNPTSDEKIPKILLGPKPTTFQHYLEQKTTNKDKLKHYNSETWIRGNKSYWHKSGNNWEKDDQSEEKFNRSIETKIKPVNNTNFNCRIRYENLSRNELGALLFALKLPKGCAHKLGMGKSIGLGSILIQPKLFVINRKERYLVLFNSKSWLLGEMQYDDAKVSEIISDFEKYILENMDEKERENAQSLWETFRLIQLRLLLDFEKGKELEKTNKIDYMAIKEFTKRNVLPIPENVWTD